MEVKRYENDELHIVLKNPYCGDHKMPQMLKSPNHTKVHLDASPRANSNHSQELVSRF